MLSSCGTAQQPFCFCSFFQVHVGNVGHRRSGFHGNLHFSGAREKICVAGGGIILLQLTLAAAAPQKWLV